MVYWVEQGNAFAMHIRYKESFKYDAYTPRGTPQNYFFRIFISTRLSDKPCFALYIISRVKTLSGSCDEHPLCGNPQKCGFPLVKRMLIFLYIKQLTLFKFFQFLDDLIPTGKFGSEENPMNEFSFFLKKKMTKLRVPPIAL